MQHERDFEQAEGGNRHAQTGRKGTAVRAGLLHGLEKFLTRFYFPGLNKHGEKETSTFFQTSNRIKQNFLNWLIWQCIFPHQA